MSSDFEVYAVFDEDGDLVELFTTEAAANTFAAHKNDDPYAYDAGIRESYRVIPMTVAEDPGPLHRMYNLFWWPKGVSALHEAGTVTKMSWPTDREHHATVKDTGNGAWSVSGTDREAVERLFEIVKRQNPADTEESR